MPDVDLLGCSPEPLMCYLKALGILRLVAEQRDEDARGWWKQDVFRLRSSLDRDALARFFLEEYRPTPILGPWAGGSGFFKGDNKASVDALSESGSSRCDGYRQAIEQVRDILEEGGVHEKPTAEIKNRLIRRFRNELPDEVVAWMDAAMVLASDGQAFAPLLGTGGNDGRLDFTQNFMDRIVHLGLHGGRAATEESREWLDHALFGMPARLRKASVGQFAPGRAGGPNATQGMEGASSDNPWEYVLALEGSLLLAGAAVRRFGLSEAARPGFPFTVRAVGAGFDASAAKDAKASRGEIWLPLWTRPAGVAELRYIFGEGRAEVSGRPARDGSDFARAVARLGVDRGLAGFSRVGFLRRSGKAFLATPLGRFEVADRTGIDLLREVDVWVQRFGDEASAKQAPARWGLSLRRIHSAIFDYAKHGGSRSFQEILAALGAAEREVAASERLRKTLRPLSGLSAGWRREANDGSWSFEIARALAFVRDEQGRVGPIRTNLEPVENKRRPSWAEKNRCVVWNAADLAANLCQVLDRRIVDAARLGCGTLPIASPFAVPLKTIAKFISGETDDERTEQLIWGLTLTALSRDDGDAPDKEMGGAADVAAGVILPRQYALLKLLFLPRPLVAERRGDGIRFRLARRDERGKLEDGIAIRPEPRILPLLRTGRVGEACRIAAQRLRACGLRPMPGRTPASASRDGAWAGGTIGTRDPRRLAGALLIPISSVAADCLVRMVCRTDESAAAQALAALAGGGTS